MTFQVKATDPLPIVGAILTYFTLNEWVAVLTIIFTLCKIYEWGEARWRKRKDKKGDD